jgi:hypothetical protein
VRSDICTAIMFRQVGRNDLIFAARGSCPHTILLQTSLDSIPPTWKVIHPASTRDTDFRTCLWFLEGRNDQVSNVRAGSQLEPSAMLCLDIASWSPPVQTKVQSASAFRAGIDSR